jgi:hypothetical protein
MLATTEATRCSDILIIQKTCDDILSTRVEMRVEMSRESIDRVCGFNVWTSDAISEGHVGERKDSR